MVLDAVDAVFFMQGEGVEGTRAEVENAVGVVAIEFSKLFGDDLKGEVLKL